MRGLPPLPMSLGRSPLGGNPAAHERWPPDFDLGFRSRTRLVPSRRSEVLRATRAAARRARAAPARPGFASWVRRQASPTRVAAASGCQDEPAEDNGRSCAVRTGCELGRELLQVLTRLPIRRLNVPSPYFFGRVPRFVHRGRTRRAQAGRLGVSTTVLQGRRSPAGERAVGVHIGPAGQGSLARLRKWSRVRGTFTGHPGA